MYINATLGSGQFFVLDHVCVTSERLRTLESRRTSPERDFHSGPVEVLWNKNVELK